MSCGHCFASSCLLALGLGENRVFHNSVDDDAVLHEHSVMSLESRCSCCHLSVSVAFFLSFTVPDAAGRAVTEI